MSKAPRHLACYLGPAGWFRRKNCLPVKRSLHAEEVKSFLDYSASSFFPSSPYYFAPLFSSFSTPCMFFVCIFRRASIRAARRDVHSLLIEAWMRERNCKNSSFRRYAAPHSRNSELHESFDPLLNRSWISVESWAAQTSLAFVRSLNFIKGLIFSDNTVRYYSYCLPVRLRAIGPSWNRFRRLLFPRSAQFFAPWQAKTEFGHCTRLSAA